MAAVDPDDYGESRARSDAGPPDSTEDPLGKLVEQRWSEGSDELRRQRRDFWQNLSFFFNEQWVWWDRSRHNLQSLPQAWSPLGPGRARLTINLIEPNLMSLMARLMHSRLSFEVPPSDGADDVVSGAMLAERVLNACHDEQHWEQVRYDVLMSTFLGGTGAVNIEWDGSAGERIEIDPETKQVVGTGEVSLQALNITEFCLETGVRDERTARWWIQGIVMSPEQAQDQYGLDWTPRGDASAMLSPLQHRILSDAGRPQGTDLTLVLTMYERPNDSNEDGRVATVINGQVVEHEEKWPFPFDHLNVRLFRQRKVSGQWQGWTLLNSAVTVQFAYNHARSVIHEHMKLTGNARLMAPWGAFVEEDFTDDPSSILWYQPDMGGAVPGYLVPPQLPRWLLAEADNLKRELEDVMHVHATSRGEASFDRASGQALALLAEKDDTPLGLMAMEQSDGWAEIGTKVLELYQDKAKERRESRMQAGGPNEPVVVKWSGRMLRKQTRARVPQELTQPRSKAAMQAFVKDLWDRQVIEDPHQYAKLLGIPEHELVETLDADVARAQRENARMALGEPELPEPFDDHAKHIAEHNRWRKSDNYHYADGDVQSIFDDHVQFHEQLARGEADAQSDAMNENMPEVATAPQAAEPLGSMVPPDYAEQQVMAQQQGAPAPGSQAMFADQLAALEAMMQGAPAAGGGADVGLEGSVGMAAGVPVDAGAY